MGKKSLYEFTCEECGTKIIADKTPRGWVRLLSAKRDGARASVLQHNGPPPVLWTAHDDLQGVVKRVASRPLPEDAYWCSSGCLVDTVRRHAEALVAGESPEGPTRGTMARQPAGTGRWGDGRGGRIVE